MNQFTLTFIDTTGIQDYIFSSNNLKHIVGASALVHFATHDWVFKELEKLGKTNVSSKSELKIDDNKTIDAGDLNSELVYAGGGNAVVIFKSKELAKKFTKTLTLRTLSEAPGLQLIVAHTDLNWENDILKDKVKKVRELANKKKYNRIYSSPLLGLGVTADCQFSGLPATEIRAETEKEPNKKVRVSSEVAAKWDAYEAANKRLKEIIPLEDDLDFVYNFNDFGTKYQSSYIAVIHTDGNGMGKRIKEIAERYMTSQQNREYIKDMRYFSSSLEETSIKALKATVRQLLNSRDDKGKIGGLVEVWKNLIPFRPIVFGGDDVTFVSDGRLGITLAEFFLKQLIGSPLSDGKPISARAGIAVVKSHYPFSRAVKLADELADSAKEYIKKQQKENISAIDWHFAASGVSGSLEEIRQREYTTLYGKLYMRPLGLNVPNDWHSWETFEKIIKEFNEKWEDKHNKVIMLSRALRGGPEAVKQFVTACEPHNLPEVAGIPASKKTGWFKGECTCFDAIEAMDFYVPLKGGGK